MYQVERQVSISELERRVRSVIQEHIGLEFDATRVGSGVDLMAQFALDSVDVLDILGSVEDTIGVAVDFLDCDDGEWMQPVSIAWFVDLVERSAGVIKR